jgi:hypothetical protein
MAPPSSCQPDDSCRGVTHGTVHEWLRSPEFSPELLAKAGAIFHAGSQSSVVRSTACTGRSTTDGVACQACTALVTGPKGKHTQGSGIEL